MYDILFKHRLSKQYLAWLPYAKPYDDILSNIRINNNTHMNTLFVSLKKGYLERLMIWREYLGSSPGQVYVGIEKSNSTSSKRQRDLKLKDTHIEVGNLLNVSFAKEICDRYGPFDLVIGE